MVRTGSMKRLAAAAAGTVLACMAAVSCGRTSLSGTYLPKGSGMGNGLVMEKLDFGSGNTATLTMMEQHIRVNYKIDGKQLLISANGQELVFDIGSDGCLDGGSVYGKFCKG